MKYSHFVEVYESLAATTKKLEKTSLIAKFLHHLKGHEEWIYLLRGRVYPDYDEREFGMSLQLLFKAVARAYGTTSEHVVTLYNKKGDLGDIAAELASKKRQKTLFSKELETNKVFDNLRSLVLATGKGAVDKKIMLIVELLAGASAGEARYVVRTVLNDLRVGVADAILRDAVIQSFFSDDEEMHEKVTIAYETVSDFALILELAFKGKKAFDKVQMDPSKPVKVMLPVKVTEISDGFRICGSPLAVEHKYDGFRVLISNDGKTIRLFTRRLEDVTRQFPDVVAIAKKHVHAKSYILDSECVGYDRKTKKYLPFESISQRIKRKYDIDKLVDKIPVELNVFDVLYLDGESVIETKFADRRKIIEKIVKVEPFKIRLSKQFVTDSEEKVEKFYKEALKIGEEGIMMKKLDAPYKPGRSVGYMVKLKPESQDLDLVIVGAEHGTGKRAGALTSYIVACKENGNFLEVGKVSSGLKEKKEEGFSYGEMDALLQPLITHRKGQSVTVKPKVVVSVTYQNVQRSPSYSSGFALRFPRITHYRPERGTHDIASLKDIEREAITSAKRWKSEQ